MTVTSVLKRALLWGCVLAVVIAIVAALIGNALAGAVGVTSAVIGAAMGLLFLAITALSIIFANRFASHPLYTTIFMAVVLGAWMLKFVVYLVLILLLRGQPWIDATVLGGTLIATAIATVIVDAVVVLRSRVPVVSLPPAGERDGS
jgi:hypothetical protein